MSRIEQWLDDHLERSLDILIVAILLLVTIVHCRDARRYSLNPDEALHYNLAHQRSLLDAWRMNNTNAHPPLLIIALYFWRKIGTSELWLRLLPILSNAVLVWFGYRWMRNIAGSAAAVAFAGLLLVLPPLYALAWEVRQYMPMFAGIAVALWAFDSAIAMKSPRRMMFSGLGVLIAGLSNYSALWFCCGFGAYSLLRLWILRPPAPVIVAWAGGQALVASAYFCLYETHISKLTGAILSAEVKSGYLRSFYIADYEDIVDFIFRSVPSLYQWIFTVSWPAWIGLLLACVGVIVVSVRKDLALLALLTVPFVSVLTAVAMEKYPFGGTRQSSLFIYFVAASIAVGTAALLKDRLARTALLTVPAMVALHSAAQPEHFGLPFPMRERAFVVDTVDYLRTTVPPGGTVFVDYQASLMLCYYYDPAQYCIDEPRGRTHQFRLDRLRMIFPDVWSFDRDSFMDRWRSARSDFQLAGQPVWVFDSGWGQPVHEALGGYSDDLRIFPGNNEVFRISQGIP